MRYVGLQNYVASNEQPPLNQWARRYAWKVTNFTLIIAPFRLPALAFSPASLYLQSCTSFCRLGGTAAGLKGTPCNSQDGIWVRSRWRPCHSTGRLARIGSIRSSAAFELAPSPTASIGSPAPIRRRL